MKRRADAHRIARRARFRGRWHSWVATCAVVALLWPALGPLPWIVAPTPPSIAQEAAHSHADGHEPHRHVDASAIPGAPTHPVDHDCAQCDVLKHLSRCVMAPLAAPVVSPACPCPAPEIAVAESERESPLAALPGPPPLTA